MTKIIAITAVVTHVLFLATLAQRSAKFVRMQASPFQSSTSAQSTSAAIECAFIALNENSRVARPAGSFGYCETSNSTEVNTTEIAFKMTTLYTKGNSKTTVMHYLDESVENGVAFEFRLQILDVNGFWFRIQFQVDLDNAVLIFMSKERLLNDKQEGRQGTATFVNCSFTDLKEYRLKFEVLQNYWQIYIDGTGLETFEHRQPANKTKQIKVTFDSGVKYYGMATNGSS